MKSKKTLILEAFRNIKNRFVSFLSIVAIMMIGIAGLMCMFNLEVTMRDKGNTYFKDHTLRDFELVSSMGVTEEDISEVAEIEGVADTEGYFRNEGTVIGENGGGVITIVSETKKIDIPEIWEGRRPEGPNECAVNQSALKAYNLSVGDKITLSSSLLKDSSFEITGVADIPAYIGQKDYAVLVPEDAVDRDATEGRYVAGLVRMDIDPKVSIYSKEYNNKTKEVRERLDRYAADNVLIRTKEITEIVTKKLEDSEKEANDKLGEAEDKLKDGEKTLNEKLSEAEAELVENEQKLIDGRKTLEEEIAKAEKEIADGETELDNRLADGRRQIDEGRAKAERELANAYNQLKDAEAQYQSGCAQYDEAKRQIDGANAELEEKLSEKSGEIDVYATITEAVLYGAVKVEARIEEKHPEIKDNKRWRDFCDYTASLDQWAERFRDATDAERVKMLKELIRTVDGYVEDLPISDEIREEFKELFKEIRSQYPKFDKLCEAVDKIRELMDGESQLEDAKNKLDEARSKIDDGWSQYHAGEEEAERMLAQAEEEWANGKAEGERKLNEARAELERVKQEKYRELEDAEAKLKEARAEFEKTKKEKETELSDGWDEYYEKKDEAETQLTEARKKLKELGTDNYIVNDRSLISSYNEYNSSVVTIGKFELLFIPLFALVASMVFFSTIAIIIDEQKKQVGGVKALGFFNLEILVKYLIFAGLGAIGGILLGCIGGYILGVLVTKPICGNYYFGDVENRIGIVKLIVISVASLFFGTLVSWLACAKLLKCTAVGLINGSEPVSRSRRGNHKGKTKGGGLYSKLIINNIMMDWVRVMVSVFVILGSCALIGFGFTTRHAFNASNDRQLDEINKYTLQAVFEKDDLKYMQEVEEKLSNAGYTFTQCYYSAGLINMEGRNEAIFIISVPPDEIKDYIAITDSKKNVIEIPSKGILLPYKANERLKNPEKVTLYDSKLYHYEAEVSGVYTQYLGFVAFTTPEGYEEIYGKEYEPNCLFINGNSVEEAEKEILGVSENIKTLRKDYLVSKGETVKKLFDMVTVIVVVLSLLLSLMVLVNLTNILVNRRMKEMLVMRINGFSLAETIGYVARESIVTFVMGIVIGTIFGIVFCRLSVPLMEAEQILFVRTPYPFAWLVSLLFNVAFSAVIDFWSFRKIAKTAVTDITKY